MALQTTQVIDRTGLNPTYSAVAASDTFVPDNDLIVYVKNGSGSSINVNVTVPTGREQFPGVTYKTPMGALAVPAGQERVLGPFPPAVFADPTTGLATITFSAITTVTAAYLKVSKP